MSTPTATFADILIGFCSDRFYECACILNLKFVALPIPEIIGELKKNWAVPAYTPTLPFLENF